MGKSISDTMLKQVNDSINSLKLLGYEEKQNSMVKEEDINNYNGLTIKLKAGEDSDKPNVVCSVTNKYISFVIQQKEAFHTSFTKENFESVFKSEFEKLLTKI